MYKKIFVCRTKCFVLLIIVLLNSSWASAGVTQKKQGVYEKLSGAVIITRTTNGVPHIKADNFKAAGFALGYVQVEDYGETIVDGLTKARGEWSKNHELKGDQLKKSIDADAAAIISYRTAVEKWNQIDKDTRDVIEGFAMGVNRCIEKYPERFESWVHADYTGYDVFAKEINGPDMAAVKKFLDAQLKNVKNGQSKVENAWNQSDFQSLEKSSTVWTRMASLYETPNPDLGSNAWALAPSRTAAGKAILLRNPHLYWDAGYYEAQLEIKSSFNWYGDFRIGAPLDVVGGFNKYLGFATTNNDPMLSEIYAFKVDPEMADHYLLDGKSLPLRREIIPVIFKNGEGLSTENREFLYTAYGPVIYRGDGRIVIIRSAQDGRYGKSEQYLTMMKARSLDEWKQAMRKQRIFTSNYTYADGAGNIFYVWNGAIPDLPLPWSGDTTATLVTKSDQIWKNIIPWDKLPHLENPKGGYLHNENSSFHFTNLNEIFKKENFPNYFSQPDFSLRSQKSYELLNNNGKKKLSLEDVVQLKFNEGILLADRVKSDLVSAVRETNPQGEVAAAINLIDQWNNTVERDSKGSTLFIEWWDRYVRTADSARVAPTPASAGFAASPEKLFRVPWSPENPATTPYGLADYQRAVESFKWAIEDTKKKYGAWDVEWGKVHRAVAENNINVAIGGVSGAYGCFRVFWYKKAELDGKNINEVTGGDGWVIAIQFDKTPRAYSVLAYGESNNPASPYYYDQLQMFADKKMKTVLYTDSDIEKQVIKRYRPGEE